MSVLLLSRPDLTTRWRPRIVAIEILETAVAAMNLVLHFQLTRKRHCWSTSRRFNQGTSLIFANEIPPYTGPNDVGMTSPRYRGRSQLRHWHQRCRIGNGIHGAGPRLSTCLHHWSQWRGPITWKYHPGV